jgi:hypothetical protein
MRLTLRTLLAYLDDTLEAAAAKEIGQKLTETPTAQELVSRIKEVTRRRRVTAPPLAGDDVDPNTLAEYLDNLLPADAVAQLETRCLESDVHLAEAAACHQILTLIGQPAGVSNEMRQRMYDLVHAIESIPAERRPVVSSSSRAIAPPSVFKQRPLLARLLTGAAILLGTVGFSWLVWVSLPPRDTGLSGEQGVAQGDSESGTRGHFIPSRRSLDSEEPALPAIPLDRSLLPSGQGTEAQSKAEDLARSSENQPVDSPEPSQDMADTTAEASRDEATDPESRMPDEAVAAPPAESSEPVPTPPTPEPPAEKLPAVLANYVSNSGVLLFLDESNREWRRVRLSSADSRSDVHESERLLCLPWYRATLQVATGSTVELVGETEVTLLPPEEGIDAHLQLDRGKLLLGTNQPQATFQVDFLNQSWRLTLSAPEDVVGLAVTPVWRPGAAFLYEAVVLVPRGEVEFHSPSQAHQLGGPVQLRWNSSVGLRDKESLGVRPAWFEREDLTTSEIRAAAVLEDDLGFEGSIALAMFDATTNERKELRHLGVECLGAIGRLPSLIEVMNTRDRREMRQWGIAAARRYIARGQVQEDAMRQALFIKFSKSREYADGVIDLLRGYSDAEFQQLQKKEYEALIKLLSPDRELLIRELAITNLEDLAGKPLNTNYNPDKPKDSDIAAWQRAANDGRLPPKVRGKM